LTFVVSRLFARLISRTAFSVLVGSLFTLTLLFASLPTAQMATPANGTLTDSSGPITYTAGPFFVPNPTAQANGAPLCNAATPCDDFTLTVAVPPGLATTHKVKVVVSWPVATADFDVYILQGSTTVTTAASSSDPEVAFLPAVSGAYTIRVTPFAPAGQSITATISLVQLPPPPPPPSGIAPRYQNYAAPPGGGDSAGEPSIGVDWFIKCPTGTCPDLHPSPARPKLNTGGVAFFTANLNELRVSFDDCSSPASALWEDKTFTTESQTTLDPIGFVDPQTGRVFHSQLAGATSILAYSDDDGETWTQSQGSGQPAGLDHQTVGGGPYNITATPPPPPHPLYTNQVYYASQDIATALAARSDTGGLTFNPGLPTWNLTQCGGLHGHVKVAPDGTVYIPNKGCGGNQGVAVSTDNGLTWAIRPVPSSTPGDTDPSVGIGSDNTIYLGYQNGDGHPHIARSTDRGLSWIDRDAGGGFIQNCVFAEVVGGDGDRAAFGFLGTPTGGNYQDATNFHGIWHFYIATTYDRGNTYFLVDATPNDPVQIGSICTSGTTCGSDRNLLDFNDIAVDREGRVLAAYADGCVAPGCIENPPSPSTSSRSAKATIIRQSGGRRLFAAFDPVEPATPAAPRLVSADRDSTGNTVRWLEPDNSGSPITNYNIYRRTIKDSFKLIATIGPTATRYLDTTAEPDTQYCYRVTAVNALGESTFCGEVCEAPVLPPASACILPGIAILTDPPADQTGAPANTELDIQALWIAQPFMNSCTDQLTFTLKVTDLAVVPPQARWTIFFSRPNGVEHFVSMNSDDTGNPTGVTFQYGHTSIGTGGVRQLTTDGDADAGSTFAPDGTIVILLSNSKLTFNPSGPPFSPPASGEAFGNINALTQQTVGILLLSVDTTGSGSYNLVANSSCAINLAPIAQLLATPTTGTAPLTVSFNGNGSSDPNLCDSVVSYTFDFNDGSAPVTQASPTISHTYTAEGEYRATLKVTDSRGRLSDNTAIAIIEVVDCDEEKALSKPCAFFQANGDEGSVELLTPGVCAWTAASNVSWINISSITAGNGNATITYVVRDNLTRAGRQGTLTIAGLTFTVTQDAGIGDDCQYTVSSLFSVFSQNGGTGTLNVSAEERCAWQATSNTSWITITSCNSGLGSATVNYSVGVNSTGSSRAGTITIAGKTFAVKQK
jgi:PKD repeat protein